MGLCIEESLLNSVGKLLLGWCTRPAKAGRLLSGTVAFIVHQSRSHLRQNALSGAYTGRVNELLGEVEDAIPPLELGNYRGGFVVVPVLQLSGGERTEKERIIRVDAYSLTITLSIPEGPDSERYGYAYAGVVAAALGEDPTLGGVVDRAVLTGKKYIPPKHPGTGEGWEVILTLRIIVEGKE